MTKAELKKELDAIDHNLEELQNKSSSHSTSALTPQNVDLWWSTTNAMTMCATILFFGIVVLVICASLLRRSQPSPESILRVFGTVLIVTGALFLVVAGYSDQQMAPVMGFLGTLAGYLLGKNESKVEQDGVRKAVS